MAPRFLLRCLGTPELLGPGGEPIRFRTVKQLALLVFLAVERPSRHRRDRLADLLWSEVQPAEGRHSVATALSMIRGKLGPRALEATRDTVRLVAPDLDVDLDRLARGEVLGDDTTPPLEVTGFLEEFEIPKAPEFMLWRDQSRARWLPRVKDALVVLIDRCRRTGDFTRIGHHADNLLTIDDLSEEGIRAKMEACAFSGDRITAIRAYQAWRQRLAEQLDTIPSELLQGMALRLRQGGSEPLGPAHVPTVRTDQWRNRPFVGRGPQYRMLYERWESANGGAGRHGLVLGDSGIGKTTLVDRLTTAAGLEGAVKSRVQCYEAEREIPYAALATLVRGLLDRPGASATPPEWLAELARTIPSVETHFPNLPPGRDSAGETARLRLAEATHELVTAIADEHPVILVVDDVHLADDASVAVLHLLMRRTLEQPVMIIMTARQGELGNSPHAGRLLETRQALGLEAVELPPLTDEEVSEVVGALALAAGVVVPPAVSRAMLRASAGVPMIVELLFDDWRAHGEHCLALSVGAMTVDANGHEQRGIYERIFERTLKGLTPPARAVLNMAAILGERLNDLSMYELADLSMAQTLAGMVELSTNRLLRDGGREVEFRNELLRSYAYMSVPSPLRRTLHGLIADRMLSREARGELVPGLTMAWHCFRAARPAKAEPYLLRGSMEGLRRGGTFEVELALTSGMRLLSPEGSATAQCLLATALQEQGRWADSLVVLEEARLASAAYTTHRASLELVARSALSRTAEEARGCLSDLRGFLKECPDISRRIRAVESMRLLALYLGDIDEGEYAFQEARRLIGATADLSDRLILEPAYAGLAWFTHRVEESDKALSRLGSLAAESRAENIADSSVARLHSLRACLLGARGRYLEALEHALESHSIGHKLGDSERMFNMAHNLCLYHGRLGNYQEQRRWAEKALVCAPSSASNWDRARIRVRLAWALCMQGENKRAIEMLERVESAPDPSGRPWVQQAQELLRADVYLMAGEDSAAMLSAERGFAQTSVEPLAHAFVGTTARWRARVAAHIGDSELASKRLEQLVESLRSFDMIDQAEIVSAKLWLGRKMGEDWSDGRRMLAELLAVLPPAVEDQLRRLRTI